MVIQMRKEVRHQHQANAMQAGMTKGGKMYKYIYRTGNKAVARGCQNAGV